MDYALHNSTFTTLTVNIVYMCVYVRVRGHGTVRSQMKPQRDGRSGI